MTGSFRYLTARAVRPGGNYLQETYIGQAWVLVDEDEKDVAFFVAAVHPGLAKLPPWLVVSDSR